MKSKLDRLREAILKEAKCTVAPKDPESVRNKIKVEISIDDLMGLIATHTKLIGDEYYDWCDECGCVKH